MNIETSKQDVLKVRMDRVTLQLLERARGYVELDKRKFIRLRSEEHTSELQSQR